jgi:hypothetical protein
MRFFLVALDTGTGTVRLIKEGTYAQRQEALDVLGPAVDEDSSLSTCDLFLVDLDQVAPVVLYRPATPTVPLEEPLADAWIAPADEVAADAAVEEAVLEGPEPLWVPDETLAPVASEDGDLADALRRAATRMESEGIVAPPSVEEFAAQAATEDTAIASATTDDALREASEPEAPATVGLLADAEPWPWESTVTEAVAVDDAEVPVASEATIDVGVDGPIEAVAELEAALAIEPPTPVDAGAPEQSGVFEPVGIDEPGLEDVQLLTPVGDLAPHPLIVGEYAPEPEADIDELTLSELEALAASLDATAGEASATALVEADPAEDADVIEADAGEVGGVETPAVGTEPVEADPTAPAVAAAEEKAYEPGGLDIAAYTCDDCVYVETCPKARQEGPATCGSFQWKSV